MATRELICNLALTKLGLSDRIASLGAPTLPLERHFARIYEHYRDVELKRHRWHFAKQRVVLTQTLTRTDPHTPYGYALPGDMLQPLRDGDTDWLVSGTDLWSGYKATLPVEGIWRTDEAMFDPLFVEVLAARLAKESADLPGVTEAKRTEVIDSYEAAVNDARKQNAFASPPQTVYDDDQFDWLTSRYI